MQMHAVVPVWLSEPQDVGPGMRVHNASDLPSLKCTARHAASARM